MKHTKLICLLLAGLAVQAPAQASFWGWLHRNREAAPEQGVTEQANDAGSTMDTMVAATSSGASRSGNAYQRKLPASQKDIGNALSLLGYSSAEMKNSELQATMSDLVTRMKGMGCRDLSNGQGTTLNFDYLSSPTMIPHLYSLKKVSDRQYDVTLNIRFVDVRTRPDRQEVNALFRSRINRCISYTKELLRGPNGEYLNLKLYDPAGGEPAPPELAVNITDAVRMVNGSSEPVRANKTTYHAGLGCGILLHELMHILGLVDEYQEAHIGYKYDASKSTYTYTNADTLPGAKRERGSDETSAFNCRMIGPENSLMRDYGAALRASASYIVITKCNCSTATCRNSLRGGSKIVYGKSCPAGTVRIKGFAQNDPILAELDAADEAAQVPASSPAYFVIDAPAAAVPKTPGQSILLPAHFQAITHPGCIQNLPYYACARNAYATGACALPIAPLACRDGNMDWMNPRLPDGRR